MAEDPLKVSARRLFLALPIHEIFHQEIDRIVDSLRYKISGIKWVRSEQVHLTLHFFGATPADRIDSIDQAMRKIAAHSEPLVISLDRLGVFPDLRRPNILWLGILDKTGVLLSLFKMIQTELRGLGFEIERRPFHPHVTLGRLKGKSGQMESILTKSKVELPATEKTISHFCLYQSHCLPEGARYEVLKKYVFSKKA